MPEYKIGDIIVANGEASSFEEARIVAKHVDGNWILEVLEEKVDSSGFIGAREGSLVSRSKFILDDYYRKKGEFFRMGATYKMATGHGSNAFFFIEELYHTNTGDYAIARRTLGSTESITVLTKASLEMLEEVR